MQRQSLIPLKEFMDARGSVDGRGMQLLEVASGTGRFATFVKVCHAGFAAPFAKAALVLDPSRG